MYIYIYIYIYIYQYISLGAGSYGDKYLFREEGIVIVKTSLPQTVFLNVTFSLVISKLRSF